MNGWARVPGSCGELVQGFIDGHLVHVTLPISVYGSMRVRVQQGQMVAEPKLQQALQLVCAFLGKEDCSIQIERTNPLPQGCGMASSTVDICAGMSATAAAFGKELALEEIAALALQIEPTDGIFLPGIALFAHQDGAVCQTIGSAVPIDLVVLDSRTTVDTVAFNRRSDLVALNKEKEAEVERAFWLVRKGLVEGNLGQIGAGATRSGLANQKILPKPFLEEISDFVIWSGGLGVNVAHSGSVIGLMFARGSALLEKTAAEITARFPQYERLGTVKMVAGGIQWAGW